MLNLEQTAWGAAADDPRLQAKQKRQAEDLPAASPGERRGFRLRASPLDARKCAQREGHTCQEQEQRSAADASNETNQVIRLATAVLCERPRIDDMPLNHH